MTRNLICGEYVGGDNFIHWWGEIPEQTCGLSLDDAVGEVVRAVEAVGKRLDILEAKPKHRPVDRRLVEQALEEALLRSKLASDSIAPYQLVRLIDLLRRALEGGQDEPG